MKTLSSLAICLIAFSAVSGWAAENEQQAIDAISKAFPEVPVENIVPSPIEGLYEMRDGAQVMYVTDDGRFLIQGDVFDVEAETNLTEARRSTARLSAVEDLGESSMIVFEPDESTHTVTVFTDIDCGYCRKLHRQMAGYNDLGIKVRYMFYPRSGPDTESWYKAESVWCADDRNTALTEAKSGKVMAAADCATTPVGIHYELGRSFGIRGTPAILTDSGELIGGYLPPDELIEYLVEEN